MYGDLSFHARREPDRNIRRPRPRTHTHLSSPLSVSIWEAGTFEKFSFDCDRIRGELVDSNVSVPWRVGFPFGVKGRRAESFFTGVILAGDMPWRRLLDLGMISELAVPMLFTMAVAFICCFAFLALARILSSTSLPVGKVVGPVLVPTGDFSGLWREQSFFNEERRSVELESSSASLESDDASSANFASSANNDLFERLAKGGLDRSGVRDGFSGVEVSDGDRSGSCSSKFWCWFGESELSWGGALRSGEEVSSKTFSGSSRISPSSITSSSGESASKRLVCWIWFFGLGLGDDGFRCFAAFRPEASIHSESFFGEVSFLFDFLLSTDVGIKRGSGGVGTIGSSISASSMLSDGLTVSSTCDEACAEEWSDSASDSASF